MVIKRILSAFLAAMLAASLAACAGSGNSKTDKSGSTSSGTQQEGASTAANADPFGKYEEPITLTAVRSTLSNFQYKAGDDIENNVWTRRIEEDLGIKLKYNWVVDESQYTNKLNVTIASGDLPDLFVVNGQQFTSLVDSGMLADLTDTYNNYASDNLKAAMDTFPEAIASAMVDGRMYAFPYPGGGKITMGHVMWIREDWRTKLGLEVPTTMQQVYEMAKAFVEQDPDGNGANDTYGIGLNKAIYGGLTSIDGLSNGFHAYPRIWIKNDEGQIVYGSVQPEMKVMLAELQKWYSEGLIDREFGVKDIDRVNTDIVSGKVGLEFGENWNSYWPFPDVVALDVNAVFKPYAIPSADDKEVQLGGSWPVTFHWAINKDCAHPEALIKLCNLYNKIIFHGTVEEGYTYDNKDGVEFYKLSPVYPFDPSSDQRDYENMSKALANRDPSGLDANDVEAYNNMLSWVDDKNPGYAGAYYQLGPEGSFSVLYKFMQEDRIKVTELRGPDTSKWAEVYPTLESMELDTLTKIIMGEPVDQTFDKFVQDWHALGGQEATDEINAVYNK